MLFCGRGLGTVIQADYIKFAFKIANFRYRGDRGWSEANYIAQLHLVTPKQPLAIWSRIEDVSVIQKSSYGEFSVKIFYFSLPWQQGSSEQSSIKLTDHENPIVYRCKHLEVSAARAKL